ncbi:class I SAM-dependent methyltransferase [Candidatus Uhrbacteria bacterium]|nr:class I SAM-dependent methyltransferase [Candidatus Uhrbacteria bacterium]
MGRQKHRKFAKRVDEEACAWRARIDQYYVEERVAAGYPPVLDPVTDERLYRAARTINHRPWWTEEDLLEINTALAPHWFPGIHQDRLHGAVLAELARCIRAWRPERVLDAGCGVGVDLAFVAQEFPEITFVGADLAPRMIEEASARIARRRLPNVELLVSAHRMLPLRLPKMDFDLVYTHGSCLYRDAHQLREHLQAFMAVLRSRGRWFTEMPMSVPPGMLFAQVELVAPEFRRREVDNVRTLSIDGTPVCWCTVFQKAGT